MAPCPRPQQEISRGGGCGGWEEGRDHFQGRRAAVFVLAIVCLGTLIEALVLLTAFAASDSAPLLSSPQWATARLLAFIGSGGICALILRRVAEGD